MPTAQEAEHTRQCFQRHKTVPAMLKACNRCRYIRNGRHWQSRCMFPAPDSSAKTWLAEAPLQKWGLMCTICAEIYSTSTSPYVQGTKGRQSGQKATLQIVDLLDHQSSCEHKAAVVRYLAKHSSGSENAAATAADNPRLPTVAQLMLSQELAMQSYNCQAAEYERRGQVLARSDAKNFPRLHASHTQHQKNVDSIAEACREMDVDLLESLRKDPSAILAVGWAEDITGEHKVTKIRIVKKNLDVCMRMVDLSRRPDCQDRCL